MHLKPFKTMLVVCDCGLMTRLVSDRPWSWLLHFGVVTLILIGLFVNFWPLRFSDFVGFLV